MTQIPIPKGEQIYPPPGRVEEKEDNEPMREVQVVRRRVPLGSKEPIPVKPPKVVPPIRGMQGQE